MSVPDSSPDATAIETAHSLADAGIPIFLAHLTPDGEPRLPKAWQNSKPGEPSHKAIDKWRPGQALCAVTGIAADVIDVDPRNGGRFSLKTFDDTFGDNGPEVYWRVRTPSGGIHLYIAPLGIPKISGFLPGIDLQSGAPDGTGRGFVFIPPTVRTNKASAAREPRPYAATTAWTAPEPADKTGAPLRAWIEQLRAERAAGSADHAALVSEASSAAPGDQHTALASYAWDLAKMGLTEDEGLLLLRGAAKGLELAGRPWSDMDLLGLFRSAAAKVIGNARGNELEGIENAGIRRARVLTSIYSGVEESELEWLWLSYIAKGLLTQWDGEKGQGKSFVLADIIARATTGRGMPGAEEVLSPAIDVLLLAEDDAGQMRKRLRAAGADLDRVHFPHPDWTSMVRAEKAASESRGRVMGRGRVEDAASLLLPNGARYIEEMLKGCGASLFIMDPVTDYLDETITTNNDASVRRALDPLARLLARMNVAGISLRHMNKDSKADAKYRGGGTTAFQNRARVHLVSGDLSGNATTEAQFGLQMVANNYMPLVPGALGYSIEDSDVRLDSSGNKVGRVVWSGIVDVSANELTGGGARHDRGPVPSVGDAVKGIIGDLFAESDSWLATEALQRIEEGMEDRNMEMPNKETIAKARRAMGINAHKRKGDGKSVWEPEGKFKTARRA